MASKHDAVASHLHPGNPAEIGQFCNSGAGSKQGKQQVHFFKPLAFLERPLSPLCNSVPEQRIRSLWTQFIHTVGGLDLYQFPVIDQNILLNNVL